MEAARSKRRWLALTPERAANASKAAPLPAACIRHRQCGCCADCAPDYRVRGNIDSDNGARGLSQPATCPSRQLTTAAATRSAPPSPLPARCIRLPQCRWIPACRGAPGQSRQCWPSPARIITNRFGKLTLFGALAVTALVLTEALEETNLPSTLQPEQRNPRHQCCSCAGCAVAAGEMQASTRAATTSISAK